MRVYAALVATLALVACADADEPLTPRTGPGAAGEIAAKPAPTAAEERRTNLLAYRERYVPMTAGRHAFASGDWVAIVAGRILPEQDGQLAPAASIEEVIRAAEAAAPDALHRFVFSIGDHGDVDWPMGGCELKHVVGVPFLGLLEQGLERGDVEMRTLGGGDPIKALFGETFKEITVPGADARMYVRPEIGTPGATGAAVGDFCVATGFGGLAVLPAADYPGSALWEVPGTANVYHGNASGRCRRALARMAWPGSTLDFVVPVALWPE